MQRLETTWVRPPHRCLRYGTDVCNNFLLQNTAKPWVILSHRPGAYENTVMDGPQAVRHGSAFRPAEKHLKKTVNNARRRRYDPCNSSPSHTPSYKMATFTPSTSMH